MKDGKYMNSKILKPYKGFSIEKSWDEKFDGTVDKATIVYSAYTTDGDPFDGDKSLSTLKKKIDAYL